jgi:hypothetical protein
VDESNKPMKGVEVAAWFNKKGKSSPLDSYKVTGPTDAGGTVELQGETVWYQTSVSAEPEGFYKSMKYDHWTIKRDGNRWEPWPVEVNLVMKKIRNPKPMYVVSGKVDGRFLLPHNAEGPLGFDLIKRDWVAPHGKGDVTDFILEGVKLDTDGRLPGKGWIHLSFPNQGDGIQPVSTDSDGGSLLMGPHIAPENGYFEEWRFPNYATTAGESINPVKSSQLHIFRIRTKLDRHGNIMECYYGKIQNGILFVFGKHASIIRMTYYLNGDKNDQGLEWDMKNNLFPDISSASPHRP